MLVAAFPLWQLAQSLMDTDQLVVLCWLCPMVEHMVQLLHPVVSANRLAEDVPHLDRGVAVEPGLIIEDQEWRYRGYSGNDWVNRERGEGCRRETIGTNASAICYRMNLQHGASTDTSF